VAQAVVHRLEVVEIDEQHRRLRRAGPGSRESVVEEDREACAVRQACQRIGEGHLVQLLQNAVPLENDGRVLGERRQQLPVVRREGRDVAAAIRHGEDRSNFVARTERCDDCVICAQLSQVGIQRVRFAVAREHDRRSRDPQ
jgi:hypothetical protein